MMTFQEDRTRQEEEAVGRRPEEVVEGPAAVEMMMVTIPMHLPLNSVDRLMTEMATVETADPTDLPLS